MPSGRHATGPGGVTSWQHDLSEPLRVRRVGRPEPKERARAQPLQALLHQLPLSMDGKGAEGVGPWRWVHAAAIMWLLLAFYAYAVAPRGPLALAGFFALLYAALATTLVPLCRVVGRQLVPRPLRAQVPFGHAARQGMLLALLVAGNVALLAGRAWSPVALAVGLIAVGIEEAIALARK
jgi:hypothetical protein